MTVPDGTIAPSVRTNANGDAVPGGLLRCRLDSELEPFGDVTQGGICQGNGLYGANNLYPHMWEQGPTGPLPGKIV